MPEIGGIAGFNLVQAENLLKRALTTVDEGIGLVKSSETVYDPTWSRPFFKGQDMFGFAAGSAGRAAKLAQEALGQSGVKEIDDIVAKVMQQTERMHGNARPDENVLATFKVRVQQALDQIGTHRHKMEETAAEQARKAAEELKDSVKVTEGKVTEPVVTSPVVTAPVVKAPGQTAGELKEATAGGGGDASVPTQV